MNDEQNRDLGFAIRPPLILCSVRDLNDGDPSISEEEAEPARGIACSETERRAGV